MNSFYLTLPSDSSMDLYPNNTQCCFKVDLPKTVHIDKETWEVALVHLITPSQFLNISEQEAKFEIITADLNLYNAAAAADKRRDNMKVIPLKRNAKGEAIKWSIGFTFPPGSYTSAKHVIEVMEELIQNNLSEIFQKHSIGVSISYSTSSKRPKLGFVNITRTGFKFHPQLFLKLGGSPEFKYEIIYSNRNILDVFKYTPNIDAGYNHLFVYSDVAEHTIVGDTLAPILRVLPFKANISGENNYETQHISHEITLPHYVPVSKSDFNTIHIQITGDSGIPFHFIIGKTIVKLHFRQKK